MSEDTVKEDVSNPKRYQRDDIREPIDYIFSIPFNTGSIAKYLARLGHKAGGPDIIVRDTLAAYWYAEDMMHRILSETDNITGGSDTSILNISRISQFVKLCNSDLRTSFTSTNSAYEDDVKYNSTDANINNILHMADSIVDTCNSFMFTGASDEAISDLYVKVLVFCCNVKLAILPFNMVASAISEVMECSDFNDLPDLLPKVYKGSKTFTPLNEIKSDCNLLMFLAMHSVASYSAEETLEYEITLHKDKNEENYDDEDTPINFIDNLGSD